MAPQHNNKSFKKHNNNNKHSKPFNKKDGKKAEKFQKKAAEIKEDNDFQDEVDSDEQPAQQQSKKQQQQPQQKTVNKVAQKISKDKQGKNAKPQKKQDKAQPNAKQVAKEGKKNDQKKPKKEEEEDVDSDESSIIEAEEIFDDATIDNQNELLADLAQMKKKNTKKDKKDKERKVTEFKFRILDMLEIFIKKTKSPQIFISSLASIFQTIKDNSGDQERVTFVEKICQIVRKFFERHVKMLPEYRDNVEECFVEVVKVLAKESKKSINSALTFATISLFKIRLQMNIGDNTLLTSTLEKALEKSALKKEISYSEEFYKEVIRNSSETAYKLLNNLLQYALLHKDGGAKERNRQFVLNLLNYTIRNPSVQELIKKNPADSVNGLLKLTTIFASQEELKKKKIAVLNKYVEIFSVFSTILKDAKFSQKDELLNKLKESVASWPETDHNLKNIQKKLLEKFTL